MKAFRAAVAASMLLACSGFKPHQISDAEKRALIDAHNTLRGAWGGCDLQWDDNLAKEASSSDKIAKCIRGQDVKGENFGQNLFATGSSIDLVVVMDSWAGQESQYTQLPLPLTVEAQNVRGFTQMVWKASMKVGCAACSHDLDFGTFTNLVCRYEEKGNTDGEFAKQVGKKGDTCDRCAGVTCNAAGPCQETGICDPNTGKCEYPIKADNTDCTTSKMEKGSCVAGVCVVPDPCDGVVCKALSQCHLPGTCTDGVCSNPVWAPGQTIDPGNPGTCDDGNKYTVNDKCVNGQCVGEDLCANVQCSATGAACKLQETCNYLTGKCEAGADAPDGTPCDDNNPATVGDKCAAGSCVGVDKCAGKTCSTSNDCQSTATCDPATGNCVFTNKPNGQPCDDRDVQTVRDVCTDGVCQGENVCAGVTCVASDECHTALCDYNTGQCYEIKKGGSGDMGAAVCITCTNVVCEQKECKKPSACDPSTGLCTDENMPEGSLCDDGDDNTVEDKCDKNAVCKGVNKCAGVTCSPMDDCHVVGICDKNTGVCSNPPAADGKACDFNSAAGKCKKGVCEADCSKTMCTPSTDQCSESVCTATGCEMRALTGTDCDDGNAATVDDKCTNGKCTGIDRCAGVTCTPANSCHTSACDPQTGKCVKTPTNAQMPCDDGNSITQNDKCTNDGKCVGVELCATVTCTRLDDCHVVGLCDPKTGKCSNPPKADGAQCNDSDANTVNDMCTAGVCKGESRCKNVVCKAVSQCHEPGDCNEATGMCSEPQKTDGASCDDGKDSTDPDTCQKGKCVGVDRCLNVMCTGSDSCNVASCVMGQCQVQPKADGTQCDNSGSMCSAGSCINKCRNVSCIAPSQCHEDGVCDPMTGTCSVIFKANGASCDDGNVATTDDTCNGAGECTGKDICDGVNCPAIGQCYLAGVCDPARANHENGTCTTPMKADGVPCNDFDDSTFQDVCKKGQCVGSTCSVQILQQFGTGSCTFGKAAGHPGDGGFGWTPEGHLYTDSGCSGQFLVEETGEVVTCNNPTNEYKECRLKKRMRHGTCLPSVPVCKVCQPKGQCYEAGVCNPATGMCTNPVALDGTLCDDGNNQTTNDKCSGGVCVGVTDPPGCFRASVYWPSKECKHDPSACSWGNNVWNTMEECCRPGNGHKDGCAPEPPTTTECWVAGKWWPNRECVKDKTACNLGVGNGVWGTEEECCKAGNAFDCGCSERLVEKECWVDSMGTPDRTCLKQKIVGGGECEQAGLFKTEEECCKTKYPYTGCAMPCKTLDVVLVIDGSGSMKGQFTNHPHGFYALIDMLRDWVSNLPLTSEKAGQILPAATANGGVRVGIVQFSSRRSGWYQLSHAIKTPRNWRMTTGGRLSGSKDELLMDIDWHKSRFINYGTMIEKGLVMAADMFENVDRPRAIVIISDGEIFDGKKLASVRRKLDAKDVIVFGVVVRQRYYHTATDRKAEQTLLPILSKPAKDHFFNIEIDDVPEKVLHGVCDPKSQWGAYVQATKGRVPTGVVASPGVFNPVQPKATGQQNIWFRDRSVTPFDDLDCDFLHGGNTCDGKPACDAMIEGSSVSISNGYDIARDTLSCPTCSRKFRIDWRQATGILMLKGSATVREYTEALSRVKFTSSSGCTNRTITYSYGQGFSGPDVAGRSYQYFPERDIRWHHAQARCETKLDLGRKGYLITVTNANEQRIAKEKLGGNGWMGASDSGKEGKWKWVTGPEGCPPEASCNLGLGSWLSNGGQATGPQKNGGTQFFDQSTGVSTGFTNWAGGEPNQWSKSCPGSCDRSGEDFAHFLWPSGRWNDYPLDHKIDGYICEWGETPSNACLTNHVGSRIFSCGTASNPTPGSTCGRRPSRLPTRSGCAAGWISTDASIDRTWCNDNCMNAAGQLIAECKPGAREKCQCVADQVKQCRCENPSLMGSAYCADLAPLASGLHACSAVSEEIPGKWNETITGYTGMPPAATGDGDNAFECHRYSRGTGAWESLGAGQCRDSNWEYFTRYMRTGLNVDQCKELCVNKAACHSVHWRTGPQAEGMCYLNAVAVGSCGAGKRRCSAVNSKPTGVQACGCTKFIDGAHRNDAVTCSAQMGNDIVCRPPNGNTCASGNICIRNSLVSIRFNSNQFDLSKVSALLAAAGGTSSNNVKFAYACPAAVCTNGCPTTSDALWAAGCRTTTTSSGGNGRAAAVLGDGEMVVAADLGVDEAERAAVMGKMGEISNKAQHDLAYFVNDADYDAIKALKDAGVGGVGQAQPVWQSNVVDDTDEDGSDAKKDGGGGGSMAWVVGLIAAVGACFAGMAGYALYSRKSKVSWSDVADKRTTEMADHSSPNGVKVYNEMALEEMTPTVPASQPPMNGSVHSVHSGKNSLGSMTDDAAAALL